METWGYVILFSGVIMEGKRTASYFFVWKFDLTDGFVKYIFCFFRYTKCLRLGIYIRNTKKTDKYQFWILDLDIYMAGSKMCEDDGWVGRYVQNCSR